MLAALASCGGAPDSGGPIPAGAPNVLLVTLDTTRADRLGCYGHEAARTPRLDALAAEGVRFERAYAHVPLTLPSHASLLSGTHPAGTGLHVNFQGAITKQVRLLPEAFAASGYRTAAFLAAWVLNAEFGLDRGFQLYDDLSEQTEGAGKQVERRADEVVDRALAWLSKADERPFFCWLHLFDAHDPYEPPEGYRDFEHAYDGELAYVDAQLGRVLDWLDATGRADSTLIVVVGDHGESLGEHGESTHGLLVYDAAMRVPLILHAPGRLPAGRVAEDPAGLVDVHATIVEACGGTVDWTIEGRSLMPAIEGAGLEGARAYGESEYSLRSFGWAPLHSIVEGDWKYIEAPEPELYDLASDPHELDNRAGDPAAPLAELRAALAKARGEQKVRAVEALELDAEAGAALGALGYMGGVTEIDPSLDLASLKNPMAMTEVLRGTMQSRALLEAEDWPAAATKLAGLVAESPESDEIWSMFAEALLELGRYEECERAARNSMRREPDQPGRLAMLGDALRGQGDEPGAQAAYERALELNPNDAQVHSRLGVIHAQAKRWAPALEHFRRFVELEPKSPNAHTNLANGLFATGSFDEGLRELDAALRLDERCVPAHLGKVHALVEVGRPAEARAALQAGLAALPQDAGFASALLGLARAKNLTDWIPPLEDHLRQLGAR